MTRVMIGAALVLGFLAAAAGLDAQPASDQTAEEIQIQLPEGRGERRVASLRLDSGRPYIAAGDVAEILRATSYWRSETQKLLLRIGDHRLTLAVGNPFVILDGAVERLRTRPRYRAGQVWVPISLFDLLSEADILPAVVWNPERALLALGSGAGSIGEFAFAEGKGMSILTIPVSDGVSPAVRSTSRSRFVVRLRGAAVDSTRLRTHDAAGRFAWVELSKARDGVDVELAVSGQCRGYLVRRLAAPPRVEVLVSDRAGNQGNLLFRSFDRPSVGTREPAGDTRTLGVERPLVVVLDPGHGGDDTGTETPKGLLEKHVVLELATRIRRQLESSGGFKVVLVRERDERVEVPRRVELANTSGGDLLLSLHLDLVSPPASRRHRLAVRTGGSQVVYEDLTPLVPGALTASAAPASLLLERWEAVSSNRGVESYDLAQFIARSLAKKLPGRRTEVVRLPAWSLEGARMPAVLIELAPPRGGSVDQTMGSGATLESLAAAISSGIAACGDAWRAANSPVDDDLGGPGSEAEGQDDDDDSGGIRRGERR